MLKSFLLLLTVSLLLGACSKQSNQENLHLKDIPLMLEGPVFEGANTAQGTVNNPLNAFIEKQGIKPEQVQSAKLLSFTLNMTDSGNFDGFSSISIQFASDKTDMIEAATINNIPKGTQSLTFKISAVQEGMIDVLTQDKFTIVADALATLESEENIRMMANLEFEINY